MVYLLKKIKPRENHCVLPGSNLLIYKEATRKIALGLVTEGVTLRTVPAACSTGG